MTQAISGVAPASVSEATVMVAWPSIAARPFAQMLGRWYAIPIGAPPVFSVGKLIALLSIPQVLLLLAVKLFPWTCTRYRLTNRRVVVERGLRAKVDKEVGLGSFDAVTVEVLPGQEWYRCGNLVFYKGKIETFRLDGVVSPESFRQTCLKAQRGFAGVAKSAGKA